MLAKDKKIDPVVGRAKEIERVIQILSRRKKNNPCLTEKPGWQNGNSRGLAQRIVSKDVRRLWQAKGS